MGRERVYDDDDDTRERMRMGEMLMVYIYEGSRYCEKNEKTFDEYVTRRIDVKTRK